MTTLRFRRAIPTATPDPNRPSWCEADETAAVGTIRLRMHSVQQETTPGPRTVLVRILEVPLVNGEGTVDVEPRHWVIDEKGVDFGRRDSWIVLVPDSPTVVDDGTLPHIDPATLTPEAAPEAAWWTALQAVIDAGGATPEQIGEAVEAYLLANPPPVGVTPAELASAIATRAASVHDHDDRYYTEAEADARYSQPGHAHTLDAVTDTASRLAMTPAERTKLTGVATAATANATDAQLRDRNTHTGTQTVATLSDLTEAVQDIVAALIVAGTNTSVSYNDTAGTFTINASTGTVTDPEIVRDVIGAALTAGAGIQLTVNDAGDSITITSTAVLPTRQIVAGTGLTGGGDLSANRTLSVSFGSTAGSVAEGNHTHTAASETVAGPVELATTAETTTGTDTTRAVTPAGVKAVSDLLVPKGLVDAKGDLLVGSAADTLIRLGVGADGQALVADAASAGGVKWATPAGGGGFPAPPHPGNVYAPGAAKASGATGGLNIEVNYPSATLLRVDRERTFVNVIFDVRNAGTGRTAHVGVWASDGTAGKPGTLMIATGSVNTDTTGVKVVAVTPTVLSAGYYWVGMQVSADTEVESCGTAVTAYSLNADRYGGAGALQGIAAPWATPLADNPSCPSFSDRSPWIRLEASA